VVTTGVYAFSRNPMYLGLFLLVRAWAIMLAHVLAFIFLPLFVLYLNRFQIAPEERFLSAYFVLLYPDYRATVRRWL
jgi:protein-S-isoprenylcysteine O-methyltransferase Ste14